MILKHFYRYFILINFFVLLSCQNEKQYDFLTRCNDELVDEMVSEWLSGWDESNSEDEVSTIRILFDTLRFDNYGVINTITTRKFKTQVPNNFDWESYIKKESIIIKNDMSLLKNGFFVDKEVKHYWFLAREDSVTSYIQYICSNPLIIKDFTTSSSEEFFYSDLCILNAISKKL